MRESELEDLVRDTRPEPRPEFLADLDVRVERRFAAPPAGRRRRRSPKPLLVAATVVLGLVVASVAFLSQQTTITTYSEEGGAGAAPLEVAPAAPEASRARRGESARGGSAPPSSSRPRAVDRRTSLELAAPADDFTSVTDGVIRVADGAGAVVQRAEVTERGGDGYATFDLRVPTARLDATLAQLSRLADVRSRTASSTDITGATVSAQDRLDDLRAERRAALRTLEGEPLRARLRVLRARIARAEAEVRGLRRRADLARVQVTVQSTGEAGAWTPGDAARDAGRVLEVLAGAALVALAVVGPFALLGGLAVAVGRLTRRRRREAVLG